MKRSTQRSVIAIILITLIATSCKAAPITSENENSAAAPTAALDANTADQPAPLTLADLTVRATLEDRPAATATIGPEGGSLSTADANGTQYTLVIPEGALIYYAEISMTPLVEIEGEALEDTFLAGVRLEPDGLQFFELVSLEITGDVIEDGAVGFTAQSDGQTFHLLPSTSEHGSLILTTNHFSDPGAAKKELAGNLEGMADLITDLDHQLATMKDSNEIIAFLKYKAEELQRQSTGVGDLESWHEWTLASTNLRNRYTYAKDDFDWDQNTPGWQALRKQMSLLADDWHFVTDNIVPRIAMKCDRGEMIYRAFGYGVFATSRMWDKFLPANDNFRSDKREAWEKALWSCFNWTVDWQANVETEATVEDFENFINLGAEVDITDKNFSFELKKPTDFKVLYIQGFFQGLCEPSVGTARLGIMFIHFVPGELIFNQHNEIDPTGHSFDIRVSSKVDKYPSIDCGQGLLKAGDADAQMPFHGEALSRLNEDRLVTDQYSRNLGFWEFKLDYNPGGGVIAQFQEGIFGGQAAKEVTWSGAKAKLSQLVNLYVTPRGD